MPAFRATRGIDLRHAKVLIDAGQDPRRILVDPVGAYSGWTLHYSPGGRLLEYDDSAVADRAAYRTVACEVGADTPASDFSGTGLSTHVFVGDDAAEIRRLAALAEQRIVIRVASAAATENDPTENVRSPR